MNPATDPFILGRQVELLYRNLRLGQFASIVNACFLVWVAYPQISATTLAIWWLAVTLTALIRVGLAARYQRRDEALRLKEWALWRHRALLGAVGSGLLWAAGTLLLMRAGAASLQFFTAFVMAGMVAGSIPVLAADKQIFRVYAWPIILAVALGAIGPDHLHIAFSLMSLLFLLIATRSADYFYNTLQDTFRLEHEKDELVSKLEVSREIAERSGRAKTEFLANISHELRTPLNGIVGLGELLSLEDLTPDQQDLLTPLRQSANELMLMLNNLIELSALEAGHIKAMPAPFPTGDLLNTLLASHRPAVLAKGLSLNIEIDPQLPGVIIGDVERLRQIFGHLVGNAIKFTDHGSISCSAWLRTPMTDSIPIEFRIADTGPGIPADKLKLLTGLLVQVDGSSVRRHGGIGVGLPIARKLVELLGGELKIESEAGVGSCFSFTLPFALPGSAD